MNYREIELTQDKWTIIDALDYDLVAPFHWIASNPGKRLGWYAISSRGKLPHLLMHRLIALPPDHLQVDHVDRNGLHNYRSNLRWATPAQNMMNWYQPQTDAGSGYRGVSAVGDRWKARIRIDDGRLHLGYFDTAEEAAQAYDEAAKLHHGQFAMLNFPSTKLV